MMTIQLIYDDNSTYIWIDATYYYPKTVPGFPIFSVDRFGTVLKNGIPIKPFKSNGYLQICLCGHRKSRVIKGVHQIVSMTFDPKYFDGCVVHHIDEDKTNNSIQNLEVQTRSQHSSHHANPTGIINYVNYMREHGGSPYKGKKRSKEFCEKCRISAIKRADREKRLGIGRFANK